MYNELCKCLDDWRGYHEDNDIPERFLCKELKSIAYAVESILPQIRTNENEIKKLTSEDKETLKQIYNYIIIDLD